jgi:heme/copper-type cytochrome/quinol oxidase subunit 2
MRQNVHVVTQQAFDAWLAKQKPGASGGGSAAGASASASPTITVPAG